MPVTTYAEAFSTVMDDIYKAEAKTAILASVIPGTDKAKSVKIPKMEVTGLGDYTRNAGYKDGSITLDYETKTFNYDRGVRLLLDSMDVDEAALQGDFTKVGSELMRTQVIPEDDAFTFATLCNNAATKNTVDYTSSSATKTVVDLIDELEAALTAMDEAEVPAEGRLLFITPTLNGKLSKYSGLQSNTGKEEVLARFSQVIEVPQVRFYSAITLNNGTSKFGYEKATAGKNLNFSIMDPRAVIKFVKHQPSRIFQPDEMEALDSYMMKFRKYGIVDTYDNKVNGLYFSVATS